MYQLFETTGFNKTLYEHLESIDLDAVYHFCESEKFEKIVSGYSRTEYNSHDKMIAITSFISNNLNNNSLWYNDIEYLVLDLDFLYYALPFYKEFIELNEVHELLYILKKAIYKKKEAIYSNNRIYLETGYFNSNLLDNYNTININVICFLDSELWTDFVFENFEGDYPFLEINCLEFFIKFTAKKILQDKETIRKAVSISPNIIKFVSDNLKDDIDVVLSAINSESTYEDGLLIPSGWVLRYASNRLRDNKEVVIAAISIYPAALEYASDRLRDDKEVIFLAVSKFTSADSLSFASERLKDESEIVLSAVRCIDYVHHEDYQERGKCEWAINFASHRLKENKEFIVKVVTEVGDALEYISDELSDDNEVVLAAITNDGSSLRYASDRLRNDKKIVLAAVSNDGYAIEYASENLKHDPIIFETANIKPNN
jgi:hypothetical protein